MVWQPERSVLKKWREEEQPQFIVDIGDSRNPKLILLPTRSK